MMRSSNRILQTKLVRCLLAMSYVLIDILSMLDLHESASGSDGQCPFGSI